MDVKQKASRNRTLCLDEADLSEMQERLVSFDSPVSLDEVIGKTIHQNLFEVLPFLPTSCVDLLIIDPPYNLDKDFNGVPFRKMSATQYESWVESWFEPLLRLLRPHASIYVCCDWKCSSQIYAVLDRYTTVRNRITWEREKGRGAKRNWKNCSEDIWFATLSKDYCFNVESVKLKRRVIAPYTQDGKPKDWDKTEQGNFRLTHPSNLWTDISIPFWSMPENTDHPTQKPEKLFAKLILASSNKGDVVFDPFLGVGTTSVVSKKLGRRYFGIEIDKVYCCLAEKRLLLSESDPSIQGYADGLFWERNSYQKQLAIKSKKAKQSKQNVLFK